MSGYSAVAEALKAGADPAMLCATCPWDRYCIQPPSMTSGEIDRQIAEATAKDEADRVARLAKGEQTTGVPVGTLMTAMVYAGRDTQAGVCPVFALRLRSSDGRKIAEQLKAQMQGWEES